MSIPIYSYKHEMNKLVAIKTTDCNCLIYKHLFLNLAHPCTEGFLLLMPQSQEETSSHTCRNDGHTAL